MTNLPRTLPKLLRDAGLKVVEIDDWEDRGRPPSTGSFNPVGVLNHHTGAYDGLGDPAQDLAYAKWMFLTGRADLPAPLCQLALSAESVVYLGAAGRANHAGVAKASGSVAQGDGNTLYVGIEWMLSGTQIIPAKMLAAGAMLNAVLLKMLGSSVQALSCHYQTSTTGKWDIGDPDGILFNGSRVLNVTRFRKMVAEARRALETRGEDEFTKLTFLLAPMEHGDTDTEMERDVDKIFRRGAHVIGGTEAGGRVAKPLPALLRLAGEEYGYRVHIGAGGDWLAVKRNLITGGWTTGDIPVIKSEEGTGHHTDRTLVWASFDTADLGRVSVSVAHYLKDGRRPEQPNFRLNHRLANEIGDWARDMGEGKGIAIYLGDQNIPDDSKDTFFGSPLTSAQDELEKYPPSGHGPIDVIASYDHDGRVEATRVESFTDKEVRLATDHFLLEADYRVRHIQ